MVNSGYVALMIIELILMAWNILVSAMDTDDLVL